LTKSTKPYFLEALYKCISDSQLTPLIVARTDILGVKVPLGYDHDGIIVFDVAHDAVENLEINDRYVSFEAIFDNKPFNIYLPMHSILAIRCAEEAVYIDFAEESVDNNVGSSDEGEGSSTRSKPNLRVL
jgi:stringent starvation protein B